jgi:propanol-preferring alcohol dehydrogenase
VVRWQRRSVYAFTRPGDVEAQRLAKSLGVDWGRRAGRAAAGAARRRYHLHAGRFSRAVGIACRAKGRARGLRWHSHVGYSLVLLPDPLGERQLLSVANLTRSDGIEFFGVAAQACIRTHTSVFPLREANEVLSKLRACQISGAVVLLP